MQRQIGRSVTYLVLGIFRIVTAEEGPGALTMLPVDVLDPGRARFFRQHGHAWLQCLAAKRSRETVEIGDHLPVILYQHRSNRIDLRAEVEEREGAERLTPVG